MLHLSQSQIENIESVYSSFKGGFFKRCYDQIKITFKNGKTKTYNYPRTFDGEDYHATEQYENAINYITSITKNHGK